MFRVPLGGNPKENLHDDQFSYAPSYISRERRMIFLRGVIVGWPGGNLGRTDQFAASQIFDDIMAMNIEDSTKPITLVIESPGGLMDVGIGLYDLIKLSKAPIITIGLGCASMATLLLAAGTERLAFPNSRFMMHLPEGGVSGDTKEVKLQTEEFERLKESFIDRYIDCGITAGLKGKTKKQLKKQILKDIDRVFWLDVEEAIEYGLIDRVVTSEDLFGKGA